MGNHPIEKENSKNVFVDLGIELFPFCLIRRTFIISVEYCSLSPLLVKSSSSWVLLVFLQKADASWNQEPNHFSARNRVSKVFQLRFGAFHWIQTTRIRCRLRSSTRNIPTAMRTKCFRIQPTRPQAFINTNSWHYYNSRARQPFVGHSGVVARRHCKLLRNKTNCYCVIMGFKWCRLQASLSNGINFGNNSVRTVGS